MVMGQQESAQFEQATTGSNSVDIVHGKLRHHTDILKRIARLSYKEFVDSLSELNRITSTFTDQRGKQLQFSIKPGSDDTIFWKGIVQIECRKVIAATQRVCSMRHLSLRQYISVYKEITDQVNNLAPASPGGTAAPLNLCASIILHEAEQKSLPLEDECCICMQNEAKTIMPCTHKFCENCCREWTDTHNSCPICRAKCKGSSEAWELTDAPDSSEFTSEMKDVLVGIADRKSRRTFDT
ncbi:RING finger protein 141-like [Mya arenaria]|uniref:RING finger protein 141-like n=1 Tax=Mya arenaria TaxID=6604 RepID=UPI0022E927C3|nr:RING finger protein 141-like [Mya arenaria]